MENEEWKPLLGWETLYEVSSLGRVRSLPRTYRVTFGVLTTKPHILKPYLEKNGYLTVHLHPGKVKRSVHSLVAEAFLGPRPDGCDVLHNNGNRADPRTSNLRYGSRGDNHRDCYNYGGRHSRGKLYREQVYEIRELLAQGQTQKSIAERYGVSKSAVRDIKSGRNFGYL